MTELEDSQSWARVEKLEDALRQYRSRNEWGDPVHHTICDVAAAELKRLRNREQSLPNALLQIKDRVEKTICPTFSSDAGELGEFGRISRRDFDTLLIAAFSSPKAVAEPVAYLVHNFIVARQPVKAQGKFPEPDHYLYPASRKDDAEATAKMLRADCDPLYTSPVPATALSDEAERFDKADWYYRTMDPDDSGDNPAEAIHRGMLGRFVVCEIASSFIGPTRYGFNAPVLDPESDDEEFLHFATELEAIEAAKARYALSTDGGAEE